MKKAKTYDERDAMIREIGFPDYRAYLATRGWSYIRQKVLENAEGRCECCYKQATAVHHVFYCIENLTHRSFTGLAAICIDCHKAVEFLDGRKITDLPLLEQRYNNWKKQLREKTREAQNWKPSPEFSPAIKTPQPQAKKPKKRKAGCSRKEWLTAETAGIAAHLAVKQTEKPHGVYKCRECRYCHLTQDMSREGIFLRVSPANT